MKFTLRWAVCVCVWVCAALSCARAGPGAPREDAPPDAGAGAGAAGLPDEDAPLQHQESRNVRPRAYQQQGALNALPSGFRPAAAASLAELAGYQLRPQQSQQPQGSRGPPRPQRPAADAPEEEEEEREEPDRLAALLQQSKFECAGRQSGYYADQDLACEVFHYCQDSVKHSWICPDGFTFHQVHLICMPPTQDNICQKSAKYHFVNEYLYRPVNEEEVQRKPNVSLRYSDRYYPAEVYHDDRFEEDDDGGQGEDERRYGAGGGGGARPHAPQVFRAPEEVDIPLAARRPAPTAAAPSRPYHFAF